MAANTSIRGAAQVPGGGRHRLRRIFSKRGDCVPDSLFCSVMLDPRTLDTPTATIGLDQYCAVLEQAARRADDPNLGSGLWPAVQAGHGSPDRLHSPVFGTLLMRRPIWPAISGFINSRPSPRSSTRAFLAVDLPDLQRTDRGTHAGCTRDDGHVLQRFPPRPARETAGHPMPCISSMSAARTGAT